MRCVYVMSNTEIVFYTSICNLYSAKYQLGDVCVYNLDFLVCSTIVLSGVWASAVVKCVLVHGHVDAERGYSNSAKSDTL